MRPASEIETAAYRLVQECLSNAARHADAALAVVEVARRDGSMRIRVSDDGRGFDPARESEGFGLGGMRERVDLLDGELAISSRPGGGTEVVADLPLGGGAAALGRKLRRLHEAALERVLDEVRPPREKPSLR